MGYNVHVIKSFADPQTEALFNGKKANVFPPSILRRAISKLTHLNIATKLSDLRIPPSNRLEKLSGDRAGQWSIRINDQWRICFEWSNYDAYNVEIADYH